MLGQTSTLYPSISLTVARFTSVTTSRAREAREMY